MQAKFESKYQVKTQWLGPGEGYSQESKVLNRIISCHGHKGLAYEGDPRHAEFVVQHLDLKEAKAVATPGTKEEGRAKEDQDEK